jgi:hypothetical protein
VRSWLYSGRLRRGQVREREGSEMRRGGMILPKGCLGGSKVMDRMDEDELRGGFPSQVILDRGSI